MQSDHLSECRLHPGHAVAFRTAVRRSIWTLYFLLSLQESFQPLLDAKFHRYGISRPPLKGQFMNLTTFLLIRLLKSGPPLLTRSVRSSYVNIRRPFLQQWDGKFGLSPGDNLLLSFDRHWMPNSIVLRCRIHVNLTTFLLILLLKSGPPVLTLALQQNDLR
jgi:hypothetical protein